MILKDLLADTEFNCLRANLEIEITGLAYDSRQVKQGYLFLAIKGLNFDGHDYISEAINMGAIAILAEKEVELIREVDYLTTADTRRILAKIAANYYGQTSKKLRLVGITGTNGKTTCSHLIKAIAEKNNQKMGIMGTLYAKIDQEEYPLKHTTPEALEIEQFLNKALKAKCDSVVMEVSSHALELNRVEELDFDVAIFTNLSQDHLDFHKSMEAYQEAKLKLFKKIPKVKGKYCIVNQDDALAKSIVSACKAPVFSYAINNSADLRARDISLAAHGSTFSIDYQGMNNIIKINLAGRFNIYNSLAAIAYALNEGIEWDIIKAALEEISVVPGRFESVEVGQDFSVIVDYAHTPDGLENVLKAARNLAKKRLICVFGCGGNRDRTKRPLMGEIAAKYSDYIIVTSDNPRNEEPEAIIEDILEGMKQLESSCYSVIVDRKEAIKQALIKAEPEDFLLIAGKGHETYQIIKEKRLDFDDRAVVRELLLELGKE